MKRLVIDSPNSVLVEEVGVPEPGPGDVLIRIAYCGICGSDLHAFNGKHPFISLPATPGHEFSGTIAEIGDGITGFTKGDRVTCEPNLVCGQCYNCKIGRYNICKSLRVMGCQGDGGMADFFIAPADKTIHLPDSLSLRDATLVEPLAVGVHAVRKAGVLFGKNIVIIGAGTIGLMTLVSAVNAGAKKILVADLSEKRLEIAQHFGATGVINAGKEDTAQAILSSKPYEGYDVVFECVGIEKTIRDAMAIVRKGGRVVVCGVFEHEPTIKMADVSDREIELVGSIMYIRRDITDAIDLLDNGSCPADMFISEVFSLEDCKNAFMAALNTANNIKVIFKVNPE